MKSGIYKITCLINNKIYIGSSQNISNRINVHKGHLNKNRHINPHLQSAWNKYGEQSFKFEIVEECCVDKLLEREQYWMDYTLCYDRNKGFNNCIKSDRPTGYKHTESNRKKMSEIKIQQIKDGTFISNLKRKEKGYKHSEETLLKMRECKLGANNPMHGKKENPEKTKTRMKNLHNTPKWNKGKTVKDDARLEKLQYWKGKQTVNSLQCILTDNETGYIWQADSLKKLSKITPISLATIQRLRSNTVGNKIKLKYKLEIIW